MGYSVVTTLLAALLAASTPGAETREHALIVAKTSAEKTFVRDAAAFLDDRKLVPITLDEFSALIEVERTKDLLGCDDVTCYADIGGALGVRYVLVVRSNKEGTRAVLSLYDQGQSFKRNTKSGSIYAVQRKAAPTIPVSTGVSPLLSASCK